MTIKRILLIDDDADDRELFCEALVKAAPDFMCLTAIDGRKALSGLTSKAIEKPDLVFLDVNMPMVSGWKILATLKSDNELKDIPVIMYSTSSFPEEVSRATTCGALCFFSKPNDFEELTKSLKLVAAHLVANTLPLLRHSSSVFVSLPV